MVRNVFQFSEIEKNLSFDPTEVLQNTFLW